jgi:hypothetical protein
MNIDIFELCISTEIGGLDKLFSFLCFEIKEDMFLSNKVYFDKTKKGMSSEHES